VSTDDETVAVEYAVDDTLGQLREVWSEGDAEGFRALVQGYAVGLENGNRLVNWGSVGLVREVTRDGEVVWEARCPSGEFGSTLPFSDFYGG
jgi:hypothetical protein